MSDLSLDAHATGATRPSSRCCNAVSCRTPPGPPSRSCCPSRPRTVRPTCACGIPPAMSQCSSSASRTVPSSDFTYENLTLTWATGAGADRTTGSLRIPRQLPGRRPASSPRRPRSSRSRWTCSPLSTTACCRPTPARTFATGGDDTIQLHTDGVSWDAADLGARRAVLQLLGSFPPAASAPHRVRRALPRRWPRFAARVPAVRHAAPASAARRPAGRRSAPGRRAGRSLSTATSSRPARGRQAAHPIELGFDLGEHVLGITPRPPDPAVELRLELWRRALDDLQVGEHALPAGAPGRSRRTAAACALAAGGAPRTRTRPRRTGRARAGGR